MQDEVEAYADVCEQYRRECDEDGDASESTMQDRDDLAVSVANWTLELFRALKGI